MRTRGGTASWASSAMGPQQLVHARVCQRRTHNAKSRRRVPLPCHHHNDLPILLTQGGSELPSLPKPVNPLWPSSQRVRFPWEWTERDAEVARYCLVTCYAERTQNRGSPRVPFGEMTRVLTVSSIASVSTLW